MARNLFLYFKLLAVSIRMQMQHRASFFMLTLALFLSTFVDILAIWVLFDRFHMIEGWVFQEVALLYGIMNISFSIADTCGRGFDTFTHTLKNGDFDRVLLRPLGSLFQIAVREVHLMKIGRMLQGLCILIYAFSSLGFSFISLNTLVIFLAIIGTSALFYSLLILQATLCFWTTESLEIMNIVTYGGLESGQYPMSIYKPGFRFFFTFIIPLACVAYYPLAILLRHEIFPTWFALIFPLMGILFLLLSFKIWQIGVRHYHSTGS